ncbi:alcohol dehydrogenase catalytic domain-containing protein, partial [candidate division KSB1 bacterium]
MMNALVFDSSLEFRSVDTPERTGNEALIRVITAGICATDLEITRGYMEFQGIPGHEFVGYVEASDIPG